MNERVTVDLQAGVADVRLDRGDKMNAMDAAMFEALVEPSSSLAALLALTLLLHRRR